MTPTLSAKGRIPHRFRNAPVALASTAFAVSIATHATFTLAIPDRIASPARAESRPAELEFVAMPPLPAAAPAPVPEAREPVGVGTDERHEGGLRVARGRPLHALVLTPSGPTGPFAVRDRLSLGDLTPRTVVRRTPLPAPPPSESDPAQDATTPAGTEDPTERVETTGSTELAITEPLATETIEPERPSVRVRSVDIAIDLTRFADLPADSRFGAAASRFDESDAFAILGLERGEVTQVARTFRSGDHTTALAIATTLPASELRTRIEGAFNARNQLIRFEGDPDRAVARTSLGDRSIVVANEGSSIALADVGDEAGLDAVLASLSGVESIHVVVTGVSGSEPETSMRVDATLVVRDGVATLDLRVTSDGADPTVPPPAELVARACLLVGVGIDTLELASPATWDGDVAILRIPVSAEALPTFARRLASLR